MNFHPRALLTEVQRLACVGSAGIYRTLQQDFKYQDYVFPKGAMIRTNLSFMMKDPAHFSDPHTFNPHRFIDPARDGNL